MTAVFYVHFKCTLLSDSLQSDLKEYRDRIYDNIFNWNERNTNTSALESTGNSNKKKTRCCHETVIIFQCIQIRKLELVKILRLYWSTCINQKYQTMNEFETWQNCNVFGMQNVSFSSFYYKNLVVLSYSSSWNRHVLHALEWPIV